MDLCALTDPFCIEADGLYHPRQRNERLVRGMQGALAEDALGWRRQRARHACEDTRHRGHCRWAVPGGFVRPEDDRIAKSPARQGQPALTGVLHQFRDRGSARQVPWWSRAAPLPLPEVPPATAGREILWRLPPGHRMHQIWINPGDAGARA